jgi:4-hydroxybenzoate polyprenyltransferase
MAEDYVRPPLLGREAPSTRVASARFWAVFVVLLAVVIVGVFFLYRFATGGGGEGNPSFTRGVRVTQPVR